MAKPPHTRAAMRALYPVCQVAELAAGYRYTTGLEDVVKKAGGPVLRRKNGIRIYQNTLCIRYADDFVVFQRMFHMCWALSDGSSKLILINEQPNHQIVHLFRLGKANGATHEPLNPGP